MIPPAQQTLVPSEQLSPLLVETAAVPISTERQTKPTTREKQAAPSLLSGSACVPTNQPFITTVESIQNAASGATRWQGKPRQPPYYRRQTEKNVTMVEYGRESEQHCVEDRAMLTLWQDVRAFSDRDADLLLYIFSAILQETNGQGSTWIWAHHFLDARGVKPITKKAGASRRRAGHRTEDVLDLDASLYRLSGLWVTIEEVFPFRKIGGKPRVYRHRGRVLTVMETWLQETLRVSDESPQSIPIAWNIRAGEWLLEYLHAPRYVAWFCEQSLRYDPENEKWEKRLSRYFLFFVRINRKQKSSGLLRSVEELLRANSLPLDQENPQRSRRRLEKALNRLQADQHIAGWEYVPTTSAELPAKHWLPTWLHWRVRITVPARPAPVE